MAMWAIGDVEGRHGRLTPEVPITAAPLLRISNYDGGTSHKRRRLLPPSFETRRPGSGRRAIEEGAPYQQ